MRRQETIHNEGEVLQSLFNQGISGQISFDRLQSELHDFQQTSVGNRFQLHLDGSPKVIFCAGSWAVGLLYGSHDTATRVTILGETEEGPLKIDISRYDNKDFRVTET